MQSTLTCSGCFLVVLPLRLARSGPKNLVSDMNVLHNDRAIRNKSFTHHPHKFPLSGVPDYSLKSSSLLGLLNLMPCIAFEISLHCVDHHVLFGGIFKFFIIFLFRRVSCHKHMLADIPFEGHVHVM
jgi:hypothetical protein